MTNSIDDIKFGMVQMTIANSPRVNASTFIAEAKLLISVGADVIIGPEMMLSQYIMGDRYEDEAFIDEMWRAVSTIAEATRDSDAVLIFGGIAPDLSPNEVVGEDGRPRKYNTAFVMQRGRLRTNDGGMMHAIKSLMPNYRIFDDARHFFSLRKYAQEREMSLRDLQKPFTVTIRGQRHKLGVMICEDMWDGDYAQKPAQNLAQAGADVLINISCSPWSWRKNQKRDSIISDICHKTGLPFIYVNNVGIQNNGKNIIVFDGASTAYDRDGQITRLIDRYIHDTAIVQFGESFGIDRPAETDTSELYQALKVAITGFLETMPASVNKKVVIGVSGGIDSALSVAFFAKILGPENVIAINMPYSNFNSDETKEDARILCENLGVAYRVGPIDGVVYEYCKLSGIVRGTPEHKTAQAIVRKGQEVVVAAKEGAFILCNGNWPEYFYGFGTLNGDQRGVIAPWGNCLKRDVYRLADYMNKHVYGREVIPQSIIDRPAMDELVPIDSGDRSDPFDYGNLTENGYHDQLVRAVIAFRKSAEWFVERYIAGDLEAELQLPTGKLQKLFPTPTAFIEDLERCFNLFHNQVFKRVQSVPIPLVDKRSFGWDFRESMLPWVQTVRYEELKAQVLARELVAAE